MFTRLSVVLFMIFSFSAFAGVQSIVCENTNSELENDMNEIASVTSGGAGGAEKICSDPSIEEIDGFCKETTGRKPAFDENGFETFSFIKTIHRFSCVNSTDSEQETKSKIQKMWSKNWKKFSCNLSGYGLGGKNIVNYAVKVSFHEFLETLVVDYSIDINYKDPIDNKTVLEYCEDELKSRKSETPRRKERVEEVELSCSIIKKIKNQ